jgi:hypothetical protein
MNGYNDNLLRPRAVKPMNHEVLRTLSEDGHFKPNGPDENGRTTAETRSTLDLDVRDSPSNHFTVVALPQSQ